MGLTLPKIQRLLKKALNLSKTESDIIWILWNLKASNYKSKSFSKTNFGEEKLFINPKKRKKGISVKEIRDVLSLAQSTVQEALTSLFKRNYVKRERENRAYRYQTTNQLFEDFQNEISKYYSQLGNLIEPFLQHSSPTKAIKNIRKKLVHDQWTIQGWQDVGGFENFFIQKTDINIRLPESTISLLQDVSDGNSLTSNVQQIYSNNNLTLKSSDSYTSPFHLETNFLDGLWVISNLIKEKRPKQNGYPFKLAGTE